MIISAINTKLLAALKETVWAIDGLKVFGNDNIHRYEANVIFGWDEPLEKTWQRHMEQERSKPLEQRQAEWDAQYSGDSGMGELSLQGIKMPRRPTE